AQGIWVQPLRAEKMDDTLAAIHRVSLAAFRDAPLYQPITLADMRTLYQPLMPHIDPALVLLARRVRDHAVVGYAFGLPDLCQSIRGEVVDTAILKTLAVEPDVAPAPVGQRAEPPVLDWLSEHPADGAVDLSTDIPSPRTNDQEDDIEEVAVERRSLRGVVASPGTTLVSGVLDDMRKLRTNNG
ncbi:MAG: hypothetical protein WD064_02555, partial [Acidimicrobiia bacterium]